MGYPNMRPTNPRGPTATIEKPLNQISANVWLILTKFGKVTPKKTITSDGPL